MSGPPAKVTQVELAVRAAPDQSDQATMVRALNQQAESKPNDALLRFVQALARAAAIADYHREPRPPDASSDNESGDIREI